MSQNTPETRPEITPQPEPEIEISQIKPYVSNPLAEYRQYGYWASEAFLPGMYFAPIHNDPEKVKFRGLIAQGRVVLDRTQKAQKLTFITIGIDNNRYIDLTIDGSRAYWLFDVISGTGKMTVRHNIVSVAVETSHFENL